MHHLSLVEGHPLQTATTPGWWEFITSPGAGGLAALLAALLALLGIRLKNAFDSREARQDRAQAATLASQDRAQAAGLASAAEAARRWWELAMWTWANRDDLGTAGVLGCPVTHVKMRA